MKAQRLIAAVAMLVATGSVFAQQTEWVAPDAGFVSTKTRAQVMAELEQAKADGSYALMHEEYPGQVVPVATQYARSNAKGAEVASSDKASGQIKRN